MKTRRPFLALVQLELSRSFSIYGNPLAWFLVVVLLACNLMPALMLWLQPGQQFFLLVQEVWLFMTVAWWLPVLLMECSNSLMRGVWGIFAPIGIPAAESHEFLSSRAIDLGLHFRAKTVMLAVFLVLPMLLNFALICVVTRQFPPDFTGYLNAVPTDLPSVQPMAIATAFSGAMVWASIAAIVLTQGYYGLVAAGFADRGTVRAALVACAPVLLLGLVFIAFRFSFDPEADRVAPVVQFFARHWFVFSVALVAVAVPVQRMCERRFAEQEVL